MNCNARGTLIVPELAKTLGIAWENEVNEAARCVNTERPLTHSLDLTEEGLAMQATRPCSVADCTRDHASLGYCLAHYKRFKRWGDANIKRPTPPAAPRFWARVEKTDTCWLWTAGATKQGYGAFTPTKGRRMLAHRWAYETFVGPIPDGLVIDHTCHNEDRQCLGGYSCQHRRCVNPAHLEAVTNIENLRRGAGYGLQNGMRMHCVNGHEYTEENTYRDPKGGIRCRQCGRDRDNQPHRNPALRRRAKKEAL